MKLFVVSSCLLVILMAAITRGSVLETKSGVKSTKDSEKMQLRSACPEPGEYCNDPCDEEGDGTCVGVNNAGKCCPQACSTGPSPGGVKGRCTPNCVAGFGDTGPCADEPTTCCTPCEDDGPNACQPGDCTGCTSVESCLCGVGFSPKPEINKCRCTCDETKCTGAPKNGKCGLLDCTAKGATCQCSDLVGCYCGPCDNVQCGKDCGILGGSCNAGTCVCTPCTEPACNAACNPTNGGLGGSCDAITGTCKCNTPPASPCAKCKTTINFDINTCGDGSNPCSEQ